METIQVDVKPAYRVDIERGLLKRAADHLQGLIKNRKVMIVTDQNVARHGYLDTLKDSIAHLVLDIDQVVLEPGESQKSMANLLDLVQFLASKEYSRKDIVIALGGGVVGDLAGFVSAVYLRGVDYIQIPTTLLAAIDSSVGGKTAIDLPQGKNLMGAFHQPKYVLCDPDTFKTLQAEVFEDGMAEMIKYGMILDPELLDFLFSRESPLTAESANLERLVGRCVQIKRDVVEEDVLDKGKRQLLNYGHTLGHALEQVSQFEISHGRAISIGMKVMLSMALKSGYLSQDMRADFEALLNSYHLLNVQAPYTADHLIKAMSNDKKRQSQEITEVFPVEYGKCDLFTYPIEEYFAWFTEEWELANGN